MIATMRPKLAAAARDPEHGRELGEEPGAEVASADDDPAQPVRRISSSASQRSHTSPFPSTGIETRATATTASVGLAR
jgi:hypothetical protein